MDEMIEEDRRRRTDAIADECEIGGLDGPMANEPVAKCRYEMPVLARIGIGDGVNHAGVDGPARRRKERGVKLALDGTSLGRRLQLGACEINFQELVGDDQIAVIVTVQQMMAARAPKIPHRPSPRASRVRSTSSAGSSRASRKEKARHGRLSARGRKVRNTSRMASASTARRTAIKVSGGCSQSEAAKSISSVAAARAVS